MEREPQTARERAILLLRTTFLPGWHPTASQRLVWAIRGTTVLGVLVLIASAVDKTLWDWLNLLIVPVVLALGGYLFTRSENRRTRKIADEQVRTDREIAHQRRQDDTLQAYLDQMGQLFLNRGAREEGESDNVQAIIRARTLTVLKQLDAERNRSVLKFLIDSKSFSISDFREADLEGADLRGADLRGVDFSNANLKAANLSEAKLWEANLNRADLRDANLNNADLTGANLGYANLENSDLTYAYLSDTVLSSAKLRKVNLRHAHLSGADLEAAELQEADLSNADLRPRPLRVGESIGKTTNSRWERSIPGLDIKYERSQHTFLLAELAFAELGGAKLRDADLRYANLYEADLTDADLTGANLQGATARVRAVVPNDLAEEPFDDEERAIRADLKRRRYGRPRWMGPLIPVDRLQQSRSLKGATMPNGQKYEDWLKSNGKGEK